MLLPFLSPDTSFYLLVVVFSGSGASKLLNQDELIKLFPSLPRWFWQKAGLWELANVGLYLLGYKDIAVMMSYMFLGGVYYASIFLKNNGISMMQKSYGLIAIPPTVTILAALTLAEEIKLPMVTVIPCILAGGIIGYSIKYKSPKANK